MTVTDPKRFAIFVVAVAALLGWICYWLFWGGASIRRDGDFVINEGTSAKAIWRQLRDEKFTRRVMPWRYYSWRLGAASKIKAGRYHLRRGESVASVIKNFKAGAAIPDDLTVTYPEGFTLRQVAERTAARGIGTVSEFNGAARPSNYLDQMSWLAPLSGNRDLEGYLFPDTYRLFADDKPGDVIKRMLLNFNEKFPANLREEAKNSGRTLDQLVTMASIVEREVTKQDDMAIVAGVLWKRFDEGRGLDADATVRYAVNKWDGALTIKDLAVDSPYNTRKYRGLPPTPICNPGLKALLAALRPTKTEYYYYLSAPDGRTIFAKTNDEHNVNKAKYLR